jgi:hypothetical protein
MRHSILLRCLLNVLLVFLSTRSAWAIGTTPPSWKPRETVTSTLADFGENFGADRSLAYDHQGNPGIAFFDGVADDLRYARRVPGVGWVSAAIDMAGFVGSNASLAYDRSERPAISYYDATLGDLKFARFNGSAWVIETVDAIGDVGYETCLAFDLLGRPAISYYDFTATSLKYVYDTDGDFSLMDEAPVTVVDAFDDGNMTSLAFDPLNRPMIAHYDSTNDDLRFSVEEPGTGWATTTVDSTGNTGRLPSIAIDPDTGFPAIAYRDSTAIDLRYAAWDGDSWNLTTVDSIGSVGDSPSLAFDPADGNPAIAYFDTTNADLKLAWHDGSAWQTQTVDGVGSVGRYPSLAFNDYGSGFPSIAYFDSTTSLFFIEDPPAAVPEPATLLLVTLAAISQGIGRMLTAWHRSRGWSTSGFCT